MDFLLKRKADPDKKRIEEIDSYDLGGGPTGGKLIVDKWLRGTDKLSYGDGKFLVSKTDMDQVMTINPDCLPGQAEIIYLIFLYRLVKWHYIPIKADEWIEMNPMHAPPFFTLLQTKERLEQQIKQGLNQITQATADYELLRSDVRKYDEILDYFYRAKKGDEHVLRSLFVDRVDAHTGEGYSMISMARRWPTIITDFVRLKSKNAKTVDGIRKELKISLAEANVLKTKNDVFEHWKVHFFDDVKDRFARIRNLLQSQEKQLEEYARWLKPYVNKYKRIREKSEIKSSFNLNGSQTFSYTPFSGVRARLWFYRGFEPEEMGKPFKENRDPVDEWVIKMAAEIEKKYGVSFVREYNKSAKKNLPEDDYDSRKEAIDAFFKELSKVKERTHEMVKYSTVIDSRYWYYAFFDIDYEGDYIKGSQGPLEMEDIYYHIFPSVISINMLIVLHLELHAKELRMERYIERLIGTSEVEKELRAEVDEIFEGAMTDEESKEKENKKKKEEPIGVRVKNWKIFNKKWRRETRWKIEDNSTVVTLLPFLKKNGPYETNVKERLSKEYATYLGGWTNYIYDLLKQTCYKLSGVSP